MMAVDSPEVHYIAKNSCCPNNSLPILIYRSVLPEPITEASTSAFLTAHSWRHDGTWGHIAYRHFHPNVHECYGIFSGRSRLELGRAQGDGKPGTHGAGGLEVDVRKGDVIVLPAGTGHACLTSSTADEQDEGEYRYVGVYPENGPKWRSEMGRRPDTLPQYAEEVANVALPLADPVYGTDGPMVNLWHLKTA